jgi:PEGA domain
MAVAAWLLAGGGVSSVVATLPITTARNSDAAPPVAGGVPLRAIPWPADAQVLVDGHPVGTTPLVTAVLPGPHQVTLRGGGELEATRELDVPAAGAAVDVAQWGALPMMVKLRPAYPGAAIADAQFLTDGRIVLVLLLPASGGAILGQPPLREAWLLDVLVLAIRLGYAWLALSRA